MEQVVRDSLASVVDPAHQAAVELAVSYGRLIDDAAAIAAEAGRVELDPRDLNGRRRLERVEGLVSGHSATSDLGPKLLAALKALGALPDLVKAEGGDADVIDLPANPLAILRNQARERYAATVDPAAS